MKDEGKDKPLRASIYISAKDTTMRAWLDQVTANGESESEVFLRLARREMTGWSSAEVLTLQREIARLEQEVARQHELLILAFSQPRQTESPKTSNAPSDGSKPPDAMTAMLGDEEWKF